MLHLKEVKGGKVEIRLKLKGKKRKVLTKVKGEI